MRSQYRSKRRSCPMCKPNKTGGQPREKPVEQQRSWDDWRDVREARQRDR